MVPPLTLMRWAQFKTRIATDAAGAPNVDDGDEQHIPVTQVQRTNTRKTLHNPFKNQQAVAAQRIALAGHPFASTSTRASSKVILPC